MISCNKLDFDKNILLNRKERKKSFHKIFVENIYKNYTIREFYHEKNDKMQNSNLIIVIGSSNSFNQLSRERGQLNCSWNLEYREARSCPYIYISWNPRIPDP